MSPGSNAGISQVTWQGCSPEKFRAFKKGEHQKAAECKFLAKGEYYANDFQVKWVLPAGFQMRSSAGDGPAVAGCFPGSGGRSHAEFLV
jgi:hypothetical protein